MLFEVLRCLLDKWIHHKGAGFARCRLRLYFACNMVIPAKSGKPGEIPIAIRRQDQLEITAVFPGWFVLGGGAQEAEFLVDSGTQPPWERPADADKEAIAHLLDEILKRFYIFKIVLVKKFGKLLVDVFDKLIADGTPLLF